MKEYKKASASDLGEIFDIVQSSIRKTYPIIILGLFWMHLYRLVTCTHPEDTKQFSTANTS